MYGLKRVDVFTSEVISVMAQCMNNPNEEKMNRVLKTYDADPSRVVYACYNEMQDVMGIIGLELNLEQNKAIILHMAVDQRKGGKGIGRYLVNEVKYLCG